MGAARGRLYVLSGCRAPSLSRLSTGWIVSPQGEVGLALGTVARRVRFVGPCAEFRLRREKENVSARKPLGFCLHQSHHWLCTPA